MTKDLSKYEKYYYWLILFFIAFVVDKIMVGFHAHDFIICCNETQTVISGTPKWIAFQSRLMGPYFVEYMSYIGGISYCAALKIFFSTMLIVEYFVLYYVLLKYTKNSYNLSLTYVVFFSLLLLGIQGQARLAWDAIDIIVFTLFAYFIFTKKSTIYFVILFLFAITNRESALFIALYIIIDSLSLKLPLKFSEISVNNMKKLLIGVFLIIIGIVYMKLTRDYLFVESFFGSIGTDDRHRVFGNHVKIPSNVISFFKNFTNMNFINSLFGILTIFYIFINFKKFNESNIKALLIFIFLFSSIFIFGYANQTRMYTVIVPFLIFFHLSLKNKFD